MPNSVKRISHFSYFFQHFFSVFSSFYAKITFQRFIFFLSSFINVNKNIIQNEQRKRFNVSHKKFSCLSIVIMSFFLEKSGRGVTFL